MRGRSAALSIVSSPIVFLFIFIFLSYLLLFFFYYFSSRLLYTAYFMSMRIIYRQSMYSRLCFIFLYRRMYDLREKSIISIDDTLRCGHVVSIPSREIYIPSGYREGAAAMKRIARSAQRDNGNDNVSVRWSRRTPYELSSFSLSSLYLFIFIFFYFCLIHFHLSINLLVSVLAHREPLTSHCFVAGRGSFANIISVSREFIGIGCDSQLLQMKIIVKYII